MAMWPFGRGKNNEPSEEDAQLGALTGTPSDLPESQVSDSYQEAAAEETEATDAAGLEQAPIIGTGSDLGPYDGDTVDFESMDFSDFADSYLNLGSVVVPLPRPSEVQVEMSDNGPRMVHVVTAYGRITPVAFAAPRNSNLWDESMEEIVAGMRNDGLEVTIEEGPWGGEIVGVAGDAAIRIIGANGDRWMLRLTLAAPAQYREQIAELGRDVAKRTFVYRGEQAIMAGQVLPVALPDVLAQQVTQAMEERNRAMQEQQAGAEGQAAPQGSNEPPAPAENQEPEFADPSELEVERSTTELKGDAGSALQQMKAEVSQAAEANPDGSDRGATKNPNS